MGRSLYDSSINLPSGVNASAATARVDRFFASLTLHRENAPVIAEKPVYDEDHQLAASRMSQIYKAIFERVKVNGRANLKIGFKLMALQKDGVSKEELSKEALKLQQEHHTISNPQLSWRVHLLPLLGEEDLYKQFQLTEPWDSPHNKTLIPRISDVFRSPGAELATGHTAFLRADGENTMLDVERNGTKTSASNSRLIYLIEVNPESSVEWTRPVDFDVDQDDVITLIGAMRDGGILVNAGIVLPNGLTAEQFRQFCKKGNTTTLPRI